MDYRRNEGFIRQSSSSSRQIHEPYENMDRGASSHHLIRRSVSPQGIPQDVVGVSSQRTGSVERSEYGWTVDRGRATRVRSRSPPPAISGDPRKRPHYDNGVGISPGNYSPTPLVESRQRRGEIGESPKNLNYFDGDDAEFHAVQAYGYVPSDSRISKEEFNDTSFSAGDKHQMLGQDSVPGKVSAQGSYRSPTHLAVTGGKFPQSSRAMDTQQHFEQGRVQYQDAMASNRLPANHSYKDGEKPVFQTRDIAYQMMPGNNSKGFLSSSSEMSRHDEYLAYQDDPYLPQANEFRSSVKLVEPANSGAYRERLALDSARDPEGSQRNASFYVREYSPNSGEHENYFYVKSREMVDDRGYPTDHMHKIVAAPRAQLDYGRAQIVYDHRDMPRPTITHSVVNRNDNVDGSGGNQRRGITYYHSAAEKQIDPEYIDMRRTPHVQKHGGEYLGSRFVQVETRTVHEDHELLMGASKDHRISDLEADYVFEDDLGRQFQEERLLRSPIPKYDTEMNRQNTRIQNMRDGQNVRMQNMRDGRRIYKPQDRLVKGKYSIQEDRSSYNPRKTFPGKMYTVGQFEESRETREEWIDEETGELYTTRTRGFQQPGFRRTERKYDGAEDREDFVSDEWLSSQELPHARKNSVGFHKPYTRYIKGNRRPGYTSHQHNSKQYDRRDHLYRQRNNYDRRNQVYRQHNHYDRKNHVNQQQKNWKRNEGHYEDQAIADDGNNESNPSEDWVGPGESVLAEDSEEFKRLVHEAFLKYSRILSSNAAVQRRYKEEGKAGSLFCIVCGRSASKEFMDTRRLVTHAFMSHKSGLRADHMGLHKAICVLLGWSTIIPDDTITWVPQLLPGPQALAQKEDLILWPPVVVIHNISLSDRNPKNWKVVTMEALETFIRGKGCIRGRIRVVLGKPADQSVMVVKFLGTFTGLGDAEKLHKYFTESKRGRLDLEMATSSNDGVIGVDTEAEKVEENILYGYLGISEDLDRVDYNTRNTGLVKSRIDILDLANAPVKNEET